VGSGPGEHPKKFGTPYVFLQPLKPATSNLVHNMAFRLPYQKQRFGPKLAGVWVKAASKIIWDPLHISKTAEASNFKLVTQIWFGTNLPKTAFTTKIGGVLTRGASQKLGPPSYFCNH